MKRSVLLLLGVLLCCALSANADIFLKPESFKAHALRVQNLKIETRLIGPFALTHVSVSCASETGGGNVAAQFIASKPRDASIIDFSYESGTNSYDGRVVNSGEVAPRAVAEPKVQASGNDTILRGLDAQNSFRARLYPVSSWNILKGSWTYLQLLNAPKNRVTYVLPPTELTGATMRLSTLDVSVEVENEGVERVGNNFNLPVKTQNESRVLALSQKNFRVLRDLEVNVTFKKTPLRATLITDSNAKKLADFTRLR